MKKQFILTLPVDYFELNYKKYCNRIFWQPYEAPLDIIANRNKNYRVSKSSDPFYIVSNYIKWITTSWTYCMVYTDTIKEKIKLINDYLSIFYYGLVFFKAASMGVPKSCNLQRMDSLSFSIFLLIFLLL